MSIVHMECVMTVAEFQQEHEQFPLEIGTLKFSLDEAAKADWWVGVSHLRSAVTTSVPREQRILVVTEPNGNFTPDYINQFGILVSPFTVPGFDGVWHQSHGANRIFFGTDTLGDWSHPLDFHALMKLPVPEKRDKISVVVSRKSILPGHRRRLDFVRHLAGVLGSRLEVYGRGIRPIGDKAEAILPSKYHLVLENTIMPAYWTEKLADAYLGFAFPIVSGPPDLARWFSPESFLAIDINKPELATEAIAGAMDADLYDQRFDSIIEARNRLMREERICPLIAKVIAAHPAAVPRLKAPETIRPTSRPTFLQRAQRELVRTYWQLDSLTRQRPWHRDN